MSLRGRTRSGQRLWGSWSYSVCLGIKSRCWSWKGSEMQELLTAMLCTVLTAALIEKSQYVSGQQHDQSVNYIENVVTWRQHAWNQSGVHEQGYALALLGLWSATTWFWAVPGCSKQHVYDRPIRGFRTRLPYSMMGTQWTESGDVQNVDMTAPLISNSKSQKLDAGTCI